MKWLVQILLLLGLPIFAEETIILKEPPFDLNQKIYYFEDKTADLTIDKVLAQSIEYKLSPSSAPSFGFVHTPHWYKINLKNLNPEQKDYLLVIGYGLLSKIEYYKVQNNIIIERYNLGRSYNFSNRPIDHRNFIIPLKLDKNIDYTIYLRVETDGSLQLPLNIQTVSDFVKDEQYEHIGYGFYYGAMMIMVIYNLFIFFTVWDKNYIYYILYVLAFIFFQLVIDGYGYQFVWGNFPNLTANFLPASVALVCVFILSFTKNFLNITKEKKFLYNLVIWFRFLAIGLIAFGFVGKYALATKLVVIFAIITASVCLYTGVQSYLNKNKSAKFYLYAWVSILIGSIILALNKLAIIPRHFISEHSAQIGSLIEILMLSFALADKLKRAVEEREKTTRELAESKLKAIEYFAHYVPRQFLKFLNKENIYDIKLGEAVRSEITVAFAAINKFDSISKNMSPEEIFSFINGYLDVAAPIIHKYNGFIDKYIGNIVMALFPHSPEDAVRAAIEVNHILEKYNFKRVQAGEQIIEIGIGIHTGELMLGTIGNDERMDTTVIGDTVNLASRLQYLTVVYNTPIMLSSATHYKIEKPDEFGLIEMDSIKVKGKTEPIITFGIPEPLKIYNSQKSIQSARG